MYTRVIIKSVSIFEKCSHQAILRQAECSHTYAFVVLQVLGFAILSALH